jgi:hypothetical protein
MSNGVYVLVTKDGYRVAYGNDYDSLFGAFNDTSMNYDPKPDAFLALFGESEVFADEKSVLQAAFDISKRIDETDDGIMFVNNYPNLTFEELTSGNKTA